ncbi:DUF2884 family protein [Colwellia sp. RSH04]|nr:DUF2884 family protein [Colwellia sp. RSH04]
MNLLSHLVSSICFIAILMTPSVSMASSQQCSINLNYGVIINPTHIRIVDRGQTQVQINNDDQLFIQGREQQLNEEQRLLFKQFSTGIREQFPEIVSIAIEGVDIGLKAVNEVIGGLTGENSASQQNVQAKFEELKWRIRTRFNQSANNYYIAPQDLNDFEELFAGEFEQEIEEVIQESIGTILKAVGQSLIKDDNRYEGGNGEERIATYDDRIAGMSKGLELAVSDRAKALEHKAKEYCEQLAELDSIESQLHQTIPALQSFNLIETN